MQGSTGGSSTFTTSSIFERLAEDEIRVDGVAKASGQARYAADAVRSGMLWAAFVGSPVAHGTIRSIDTRQARAMPGVHAVLTGRDVGERYFGRRYFDWPVLSIDRVRFIGEFVAAVAAETPEIAKAAAAAISVVIDALPPLFDPEGALTEDAPILHEDPERYPFIHSERPVRAHRNVQGHGVLTVGDIDAGIAKADRVFEHTFTTPRYHGGYLEPRACLVWIEAGIVNVVSTNKSPFMLRTQLSICTGVPEEHIVIHPVYIGGDFGAKGLSIEEFPCYFLAVATGRPVKSVRSYVDDIRSTNVRHASRTRVRTGIMRNGMIVAQDVDVLFDGGAYAAGKPIPTLLPGLNPKLPYRITAFRLTRTCVYTNTIPGCFIRSPGDVQIMFALESAMDMIARELSLDPLDLRRLNAVIDGDRDIQGHPIVEPRAVEVLDRLEAETAWRTPLARGRGRGMALTLRHIGNGKAHVQLVVQRNGDLLVRTGTTEQGMGILTVLQRIVAAELGLPLSRVRAERGATDVAGVDPGVGSSRTTHISGGAARDACRRLRERLAGVARGANLEWEENVAALFGASSNDVVIVSGTYEAPDTPGAPEYNDFVAYGVQVTVDGETGAFTIDDVVLVTDVGTIINPVAHRGQIDGGFIFGLGAAITEELRLEEGRITNLSFADYKLPTMRDIPPFRVALIHTSTGPGPFGARAVGELNLSGIAPAIANAIVDAVGVRITTLPITAERIHAELARVTLRDLKRPPN